MHRSLLGLEALELEGEGLELTGEVGVGQGQLGAVALVVEFVGGYYCIPQFLFVYFRDRFNSLKHFLIIFL